MHDTIADEWDELTAEFWPVIVRIAELEQAMSKHNLWQDPEMMSELEMAEELTQIGRRVMGLLKRKKALEDALKSEVRNALAAGEVWQREGQFTVRNTGASMYKRVDHDALAKIADEHPEVADKLRAAVTERQKAASISIHIWEPMEVAE